MNVAGVLARNVACKHATYISANCSDTRGPDYTRNSDLGAVVGLKMDALAVQRHLSLGGREGAVLCLDWPADVIRGTGTLPGGRGKQEQQLRLGGQAVDV